MNQTIERQQGAVKFTKPKPSTSSASDTTFFSSPDSDCIDGDWNPIIETVCSFVELGDDWDGAHSVAPSHELISMAVELARQLKASLNPAPLRVVAGVNGTISFEFGGEPAMEIEVVSSSEAEVYEAGKLVRILRTDETV